MEASPLAIDPDDAADAALAYAIWDAENSTRMQANCIQEHIARAKAVRYWLKVHGHDVVANGQRDDGSHS
jgi:hypothetical protein